MLQVADCAGCLDHDSFAELGGIIAQDPGLIDVGLRAGDVEELGQVGRATLRRVLNAVETADTLTEIERGILLQAIADALALP